MRTTHSSGILLGIDGGGSRGRLLAARDDWRVIEPIASGDGWREERNGLYRSEFLETRRHWFTGCVEHDTRRESVNLINLIEGDEVIVESPTGAFEPFIVHYAETFVVPTAVGRYTIRPHGASVGKGCGTLKVTYRV